MLPPFPPSSQVNYAGYGAAWLDKAFGTFADSFAGREGPSSSSSADGKVEDEGEGEGEGGTDLEVFPDSKSTLVRGPFSLANSLYMLLSAACVGVWAWAACDPAGFAARAPAALASLPPLALALLAGAGPVLVAFPFQAGGGSPILSTKVSLPARLLQLGAGVAVTVVPLTYAALLALGEGGARRR